MYLRMVGEYEPWNKIKELKVLKSRIVDIPQISGSIFQLPRLFELRNV